MKRLFTIIIMICLATSSIACSNTEMEVYTEISEEYEAIDKEVEAILNSVDSPEMQYVVNIYKELRGAAIVKDEALDISEYTDVDTINDSEGRILCHIITDRNTSSIYVVLPLIDKTLILDGSIVEKQLYSLIEKGTGIKIK